MCFTSTGRIDSVGSDDRGAVDVLPFLIRGGNVEQAPPLLACQRAPDRPLTLRQVLDVIRQSSPSAAEPQYTRQHADIHIDRAVRDASVVTCVLEVRDGRRCDCGQRHVLAEVLLDDAEPLFLKFDRASRAPDGF